jgi:hypothetical protein
LVWRYVRFAKEPIMTWTATGSYSRPTPMATEDENGTADQFATPPEPRPELTTDL